MYIVHVFSEFAKEKERVESRAGFMALKESQRLEKELTGYVDWICRAGCLFKIFAGVSFLTDSLRLFQSID